MAKSYNRFVINFFLLLVTGRKNVILVKRQKDSSSAHSAQNGQNALRKWGNRREEYKYKFIKRGKWKSKRIKFKFVSYFIWCVLMSLRYFSSLVVARNYPFNSDGSEELLNGGETRDKLSLVFSLFPPSTDSSEGYSLRGSLQWFWGQLTGRVSMGVTIRVGLRPFERSFPQLLKLWFSLFRKDDVTCTIFMLIFR